jgi:hypothetical protein
VVKQTTASGLLKKKNVENPTSEMPPPRKLKKDEKDNFSTAMEL